MAACKFSSFVLLCVSGAQHFFSSFPWLKFNQRVRPPVKVCSRLLAPLTHRTIITAFLERLPFLQNYGMFNVLRTLLKTLPSFYWGPLFSTPLLPLTSTSPSLSSHHFLEEALPAADRRSQVQEGEEEPSVVSCQPQRVALPLFSRWLPEGTHQRREKASVFRNFSHCGAECVVWGLFMCTLFFQYKILWMHLYLNAIYGHTVPLTYLRTSHIFAAQQCSCCYFIRRHNYKILIWLFFQLLLMSDENSKGR